MDTKFEIKEPIWKSQSVGLSCKRIDEMRDETWVQVEITYTDSKGKRLYPDLYTIRADKVKTKRVQVLSMGTELYIVPIADMVNQKDRDEMRKEHVDKVLEKAGVVDIKEDPLLKDMNKAYDINDQIKDSIKKALNSYIDKPVSKTVVTENLKSLLGSMTPDVKYDVKVDYDEKDPRKLNVTITPILEYIKVDFSYEVPSDIDKLADDIHKYACEKGFWDCPLCKGKKVVSNFNIVCPECNGTGKWRNDGECIALMHSELTEALEEIRAGKPAEYRDDINPDKPEGWAVELADCVIRIMDFMASKGIKNFNQIIEDKMKFNRTRPFKHGKKF